jgi:hypothetical protein
VGVNDGVRVKVAVLVVVGVKVDVEVAVHAAAVIVACSSGEGPQALISNIKLSRMNVFLIDNP